MHFLTPSGFRGTLALKLMKPVARASLSVFAVYLVFNAGVKGFSQSPKGPRRNRLQLTV
jgi:hypothetical protein